MSELSEVVANGTPTRTIAVESEDAAAVIRAVRELGLGGYTNTSYPRGLAALVDGAPARFAVIDVGTNSVKFHVGEREPGGGAWRTVVDRSAVTRLGEGFGTERVITAAALERTAAAIEGMVGEARQHGVLAIAAVGTAGLRIAANAADAIAAIRSRTGVHVEVVSGEDESRLAYLAARSGLGTFTGSLVVFDTGGGSSQFSFGHDASVDERFSVDVGAVRFTERYKLDGVVSPDTLREAMAAMSADLSRLDGRAVPDARGGDGRRGDQHDGGRAPAGHLRPRGRPGHRARTLPRSIARSSSIDRWMRPPGARSSACSPSAKTSSSPEPASCARCWASWARTASPSAIAACATACWPSASRREPLSDVLESVVGRELTTPQQEE